MPPTTDVPILLLDVDGVLNAARLDLPDGWQRGTFNGFVLSWDPTAPARLRELHESGRVEIQWLTTWTTNADRLLAEPMGLPRGLKTPAPAAAAPTGFVGPLRGPGGPGADRFPRQARRPVGLVEAGPGPAGRRGGAGPAHHLDRRRPGPAGR